MTDRPEEPTGEERMDDEPLEPVETGEQTVESPEPEREPDEAIEAPEPDETAQADEAAETERAARSERGRRAGLVALRVVRGTVAVGAAVVVVLAVGLIPLPTVAIEPPAVTVVPEPADELRLCAGGLLRLGDPSGQDAGTASAIGAPEVSLGSIGGSLAVSSLPQSDAGTGGTPAAPQLLRLTPEPEAVVGGAQSQAGVEEIRGFAAAACAEPSGSTWLVGGSTAVGRTTLLLLGNPTDVDAEVTIEILGEHGRVQAPGMAGIHVAPGTQRILSLAGFAPGLASPVVHVESRGGRVVASLQQTTTRVLDPGGVELIGESAVPATRLTIPGIRILDAVGVNRTLGFEDYDDILPTVRLVAPGAAAHATVNVVPEDPALTGTSFVIDLEPGIVTDLPIDAAVDFQGGEVPLADGRYTVTVEADVPVLAAVRVSTAQATPVPPGTSEFAPPLPPTTDFAWVTAASALRGPTLVTVADGPDPVLTVANPGTTDLSVMLEPQDGGDPVTLVVPAQGSASAEVAPGTSYLVVGGEGAVVAVSYAAVGRLATYTVASARPGSGPIVVIP